MRDWDCPDCMGSGRDGGSSAPCPTCLRRSELDSITRRVTAFRSFAELEAACAGGYVPTLMPISDPRMQALADALVERGHRVFTGLLDADWAEVQKAMKLGKQGRPADAPRDERGRLLPDESKGSDDNLRATGRGRAYTVARLIRDGHEDAARDVHEAEAELTADLRRSCREIRTLLAELAARIEARHG